MPSTTKAATLTIRNQVDSALATAGVDSVKHENAPYDPPTDDSISAAVFVRTGEQVQSETGGSSRYFRTVGIVVIAIFAPLAKGDGATLDVYESLASSLRGSKVSGVLFRAPRYTVIGEESGWYRVNVELPFQFDSVD